MWQHQFRNWEIVATILYPFSTAITRVTAFIQKKNLSAIFVNLVRFYDLQNYRNKLLMRRRELTVRYFALSSKCTQNQVGYAENQPNYIGNKGKEISPPCEWILIHCPSHEKSYLVTFIDYFNYSSYISCLYMTCSFDQHTMRYWSYVLFTCIILELLLCLHLSRTTLINIGSHRPFRISAILDISLHCSEWVVLNRPVAFTGGGVLSNSQHTFFCCFRVCD